MHSFLRIALLLVFVIPITVRAQDSESSGEAQPSAEASGDSESTTEGTGEIELAESAEELLKFVVTQDMETAITNGLKALADLQQDDGSWDANVKVAVSSLAGLALLASGSQPNSGPYGEHIGKTVDWLLSVQDPNSGYITADNDGSRIHGHGYALLFLSQVYGQSNNNKELRDALTRAVKCLEAGQTKDGGWGYVPDDNTWDEGSTTICVIQGLRAAQDAGVGVKNKTVSAAIGYLEKIAEPKTIKMDGELQQAYTFMYSLSSGSSSDSYALAAAACSCINNIGVYSKTARWNEKDIGKILDGGMRWLMYNWKNAYFNEKGSNPITTDHYFYYANQYASQAAWQYEDVSYFKYYYPRVRDLLVDEQKRFGGRLWPSRNYGNAYSTAFALLILQIPYQYLPAFKR